MIGVLGAGQLGRMLALAGYPLGLRFRFLDAAHEAPVRDLAEFLRADFSDHAALDRFAAGLDVATYEFENVPVEAVEHLARRVPVYPPPAALRASQDRLEEKTFFRGLGIPTAPIAAISERADLDRALDEIGYPAILKTRRMGYDGKGQCLIRERAAVEQAWQTLQRAGSVSGGSSSVAYASGSLLLSLIPRHRRLVFGFLFESQAIQHVLDSIEQHAQFAANGEKLPTFLDTRPHFFGSETMHAGSDTIFFACGQDVLHRLGGRRGAGRLAVLAPHVGR